MSAQAEEAQYCNDDDDQTHDIDNAVHIVLSLKLKKSAWCTPWHGSSVSGAEPATSHAYPRWGMLIIALASGGPDSLDG